MAVGSHLTMVPQLLSRKLCLSNFNTTLCSVELNKQENAVHQQAADWNMIMFLVVMGPSIIAVLMFGTISGMFSKKHLLILPPTAMVRQTIVYLMSSKYMGLHIGFLVSGAALTCFHGDVLGTIILAC